MKSKLTIALIAVLVAPLGSYFVPYAYALSVSSSNTYNNTGATVSVGPGLAYVVGTADCNSGDYATGGGFSAHFGLEITYSGPGAAGEWLVEAYNPTANSLSFLTFVVCQAPITVAGITVPEFGSLYSAVALAAVLYFGLTMLRQRRTPSSIALPQ